MITWWPTMQAKTYSYGQWKKDNCRPTNKGQLALTKPEKNIHLTDWQRNIILSFTQKQISPGIQHVKLKTYNLVKLLAMKRILKSCNRTQGIFLTPATMFVCVSHYFAQGQIDFSILRPPTPLLLLSLLNSASHQGFTCVSPDLPLLV